MFNIKKYLPFLRANLMSMFIYRVTIWLWVMVDVFQFVMMIFLWRSVYAYNDVIQGFTFNEMLIYFLLVNLFFLVTQVDTLFIMSEEIKEGRMSLYLVKPISYRVRLVFENLGRVLGGLILILPIVFLTGLVLTLVFDMVWSITLIQVGLALLFLPFMFMLMHEFYFLFGTLVIYTANEFGLAIFLNVLVQVSSGQLIPLALYPNWMIQILKYLPFRFITYPPQILLGKIDTTEALIGLGVLGLWVLAFMILNHLIFRFSLKKMVVFGG